MFSRVNSILPAHTSYRGTRRASRKRPSRKTILTATALTAGAFGAVVVSSGASWAQALSSPEHTAFTDSVVSPNQSGTSAFDAVVGLKSLSASATAPTTTAQLDSRVVPGVADVAATPSVQALQFPAVLHSVFGPDSTVANRAADQPAAAQPAAAQPAAAQPAAAKPAAAKPAAPAPRPAVNRAVATAAHAAPARHAAAPQRHVAQRPAAPAKPYLIYDSVTPTAIPSGQRVATYVNGSYAASASSVAGRGHVLWIDTNGSDPRADVLDVEPGDATPAGAAQWVQARLSAQPHSIATVYTMLSDWGQVKADVGALPNWMHSHVRYWIADPTGYNHIVPGADATQWYWGTNYDITTAAPNFQA